MLAIILSKINFGLLKRETYIRTDANSLEMQIVALWMPPLHINISVNFQKEYL